MTAPGSTQRNVRVASGIGLAIGWLVYALSLLDYSSDLTRTASAPGYWSNLYDVQARALMNGHLNVPTGSLGIEGIVHDGKTYMYFPLFPALLRLPVLLTTHEFDGRLTLPSMALAWVLFAAMTTRLFWLVRRVVAGDDAPTRLHATFGAIFIAAATGGTTLSYDASLPWVYHEAYVWGAAAAIGAMYWMVRLLTDGDRMSVRWLAAFVLLAVLTRPTEGWAVGVATVGIAVWVFARRATHIDRTLWWQVLLAGVLPLVVGVVISQLKFDSLYLHPLSEQVWTTLSPHRREALAVNGGSLTGLQFFATSFMAYFRMDGIRFVDYFPWITLPAEPAKAFGNAFVDQTYRTGSVTAFMPMLLLLTLVATAVLVRRRARPELRELLFPLAAGVLTTGGVMAYGYYAFRYATDFVPAFVLGGCIGFAFLGRWLEDRRRLAAGAVTLAVLATLYSIVAHLAVGLPAAAITWSGGPLSRYVNLQVDISGSALADKVTSTDSVPIGGSTDQLAVQGDCEALYLNTGDAYREWATVAARDLTFVITRESAPHAGDVPLFAVSTGATGRIETVSDGRVRVVLTDADTEGAVGKWTTVPAAGLHVTVRNVTQAEHYAVSTKPGGDVGGLPNTWHDKRWIYTPASIAPARGLEEGARDVGLHVRSSWSKAPAVCRKVDDVRPELDQ